MSKYCKNHERTWKEAHARLQAKLQELKESKSIQNKSKREARCNE